MGFSSSTQDVKGYSSSRPPLVIFVICLLLFSCATLAMAFYIQYAELILNPEIKVTWKKLLSRLGSLHLCTFIEDEISEDDVAAMTDFIEGGTHNSSSSDGGGVSITVAASLFLLREFKKFPQGTIAVSGRIEIDEFSSSESTSKSHMNMTFTIPRNLTETTYKDTCVILTGPSWLLRLGRRSNVCIPSSINRTVTHIGRVFAVGENDTGTSCRRGSYIRLNYNNQSDEFFLSEKEKWNIYIRLIHFSSFLFIAAFTFLCYFLIRGRMYSSVVKIPLTL